MCRNLSSARGCSDLTSARGGSSPRSLSSDQSFDSRSESLRSCGNDGGERHVACDDVTSGMSHVVTS